MEHITREEYHSKSQRQVERFFFTIKQGIRRSSTDINSWINIPPSINFEYNSFLHRVTKVKTFLPFNAMILLDFSISKIELKLFFFIKYLKELMIIFVSESMNFK